MFISPHTHSKEGLFLMSSFLQRSSAKGNNQKPERITSKRNKKGKTRERKTISKDKEA